VSLIKRFVSGQAKIIDPKHTGVCAAHQRKLSQAIKRARFLGLLPYVRRIALRPGSPQLFA
jgi:small subunit ribosomal protein S18